MKIPENAEIAIGVAQAAMGVGLIIMGAVFGEHWQITTGFVCLAWGWSMCKHVGS